MKDSTARIIGLALFIFLSIVRKKLGAETYWILVALLIVVALVMSRVRMKKFVKEHSRCPLCGAETERVKRKRSIDPKKEKVHMGGKRIISGKVTEIYTAMSCTKCDWETPYN